MIVYTVQTGRMTYSGFYVPEYEKTKMFRNRNKAIEYYNDIVADKQFPAYLEGKQCKSFSTEEHRNDLLVVGKQLLLQRTIFLTPREDLRPGYGRPGDAESYVAIYVYAFDK